MLRVTDLTKTFTTSYGDVTAVDHMSFEVADGEIVAIVGPSGSGKSTMLGLLGLLDEPTSGSIEVGDRDVSELSAKQRSAYRCSTVGFVFQSYQLIANLSALENVMLPMEYAGVDKEARRERAAELLDRVGITGDMQSRRPGRLSGGEQQRVAVARALSNEPSLILADEPTGNLDSKTGKKIIALLKEVAAEFNATVLVVTHDEKVADAAGRRLTLEDGKLVA
jgi:putative ABC transport system ATP-binding protein